MKDDERRPGRMKRIKRCPVCDKEILRSAEMCSACYKRKSFFVSRVPDISDEDLRILLVVDRRNFKKKMIEMGHH